jgi:hypothetical protein
MDLIWGKSPLAKIAMRSDSGGEVIGDRIEPPDDRTAITLASMLLSLEGDYVVIHDDESSVFRAWLERDGTDHTREKITVVPCERNECHRNCATIWKSSPDTVSIVTGYCLSSDAMWREHTWLMDGTDAIIETTVPRTRYFGMRLNGENAQEFCDAILGPTPSEL